MKPSSTAIGISIVLLTITVCAVYFMRSCASIPTTEAEKFAILAGRIADGVSERLNFRPEIKIDRETEIASDSPVLELITVKRDFTHEYVWEHKWFGSTKRIKLKGYFTAFGGFDLNEEFYININSEDLSVDLNFPQPRLLTRDLKTLKILEDRDGLWNKITKEDRETVHNEILKSAEKKMRKNQDFLNEAKRMLELQVAEVITQNGGKLGYSNGTKFEQPIE